MAPKRARVSSVVSLAPRSPGRPCNVGRQASKSAAGAVAQCWRGGLRRRPTCARSCLQKDASGQRTGVQANTRALPAASSLSRYPHEAPVRSDAGANNLEFVERRLLAWQVSTEAKVSRHLTLLNAKEYMRFLKRLPPNSSGLKVQTFTVASELDPPARCAESLCRIHWPTHCQSTRLQVACRMFVDGTGEIKVNFADWDAVPTVS